MTKNMYRRDEKRKEINQLLVSPTRNPTNTPNKRSVSVMSAHNTNYPPPSGVY